MKIVVLGTGLVGRAMALDLASDKDFEVTAVDRDEARLKDLADRGLKTLPADLSRQQVLKEIVDRQDLALNALPGWLGFQALRTCLESLLSWIRWPGKKAWQPWSMPGWPRDSATCWPLTA